MKIIRAAATVALALSIALAGTASANDKVTICHAAGKAGTTKYVTLTISHNALYGANGNAGHFSENGTPRAGHEQDYFGACKTTTPDPTPTPTPKTTPTPDNPTVVAKPTLPPTDMADDMANAVHAMLFDGWQWFIVMALVVGLAFGANMIVGRKR